MSVADPGGAPTDPTLLALTAAQQDLLREVATIGAGRAATALAVLTGWRVRVSVPEVQALPLAGLAAAGGAPDEPVVGLRIAVRGDLSGTLVWLFAPPAADALAARVQQRALGSADAATLLDSTLRELGGMQAGAYLAGVGQFVGKVLGHQPPVLHRGTRGEVVRAAGPALGRPGAPLPCLAHEVVAEDAPEPLHAQVRWLLDPPSLHALLRAMGLR